jgi:hypothetical protein
MAAYTRTEPTSPWASTSAATTPAAPNATRNRPRIPKGPRPLNTAASVTIRPTLTSSAGCREKPANRSHPLVPLTSVPSGESTTNSRTMQLR